MATSQKNSSLTGSAVRLAFAKTLAFVFTFALPLLLVRRLSQTEFGLYKQVFLLALTVSGILPLGFGTSAFYFLPRERERQGAVVLNVLIFNALVGGFALSVLLFKPDLLQVIFNSPALVPQAPLIGLLILVWIVSYFLEVSALANQEVGLSTIFIIAASVSRTALLLTATIVSPSVRALLYAAVFQGVLQTIALLFYLRSRFGRFWSKFDWTLMRLQLGYALPLGCAALLHIALSDLHNYFVSYRYGPAAFALYSVGCFSLPLVGIIIESIGSVMIPRVSQLQKEGKTREIILVTASAMRKLSAIYFALYALLLVVGRELIAFLFTEQYLGSWPVFAINLTLLPFMILVVDPIYRAYAEHRYFLLKLRAVASVVIFVALWLGTKHFGLVGAILAMICVSIADRLIEAFRAWRIVGVTLTDIILLKDVGKVAIASLAAGCLTAGVRLLVLGARPFFILAVCSITFGCAYLVFMWLLAFPTDEEYAILRGKAMGLQRVFGWRRAVEPIA